MLAGTRARNADELAEIINQALDKFENLHAAITQDEILIGKSGTIVEPIVIGPTRLLTTIVEAMRVAGRNFSKICAISITAVLFLPLRKPIIEISEQVYRLRTAGPERRQQRMKCSR